MKLYFSEMDWVPSHVWHTVRPLYRSSRPEVFLGKGVLKIWSKFAGEHPCRSAISIKLLCIFIEIAFRHGCFPVNLLHIFRTPFLKNTSGRLLLDIHARELITHRHFTFLSIYYCRPKTHKSNVPYARPCSYTMIIL